MKKIIIVLIILIGNFVNLYYMGQKVEQESEQDLSIADFENIQSENSIIEEKQEVLNIVDTNEAKEIENNSIIEDEVNNSKQENSEVATYSVTNTIKKEANNQKNIVQENNNQVVYEVNTAIVKQNEIENNNKDSAINKEIPQEKVLVEENTGLIYSVAKRFVGRGVEMEDLIQIGSIGLLKAVDHFNASFEVKFSTYAVPMIAGEIKRYLRDDGILKVSRSLKENCVRIYSAREKLEKELGREPVMEEIAQSAQLSVDEVVMSLESGAEVESLHKIIYQGDGNDISLMDRLQEKENGQDAALNRIFLDEILKKLDARERQLIYMRYFKDMTQTEIAAEMGISQVQVSRMEKRILKQLKDQT